MTLDGTSNFRVENEVPFSLFNDQEGDFLFSGHFSEGNHTFTVSQYDQDNGQGNILRVLWPKNSEWRGTTPVYVVVLETEEDLDKFSIRAVTEGKKQPPLK